EVVGDLVPGGIEVLRLRVVGPKQLLDGRDHGDAGDVVAGHPVAGDDVVLTAVHEDAVADRDLRDVDRGGLRVVVVVDEVAHDGRRPLRRVGLPGAAVGDDATAVVVPRRSGDDEVAARVGARVAEP